MGNMLLKHVGVQVEAKQIGTDFDVHDLQNTCCGRYCFSFLDASYTSLFLASKGVNTFCSTSNRILCIF